MICFIEYMENRVLQLSAGSFALINAGFARARGIAYAILYRFAEFLITYDVT
jgi:hypothetical protein